MSKNLKGWSYRIYPEDADAQAFGPFAPLVELWRAKAGDNRYPAWRDFDMGDFPDWWGRLSLCDVHLDPLDIEFVLWGTQLTDWWGMDYTRKKMSEVYERRQENWHKFEGPYFRTLTEVGGIGIIGGDLRILHRGHVVVQGVDLPLLKNGRVAQVFSGYRLAGGPDGPATGIRPVWQA